MHIHVEGNDGMAKFDLVEDEFVLKTVYNIKSNDLKKIKEVIDYNKYNQQIEFYAKIKTKRQKSPKITKRNGCSKSKHTNHINTQRTQSKRLRSLFLSK